MLFGGSGAGWGIVRLLRRIARVVVVSLGGGSCVTNCINEVFAMNEVLAYLQDEEGASAAEYALILAIVGTAIAAAMLLLGNTIANSVDKAANCISNTASCT